MSYNGYNYSPYFQLANENSRGPQSFSTQSHSNAPYYRQPQQTVTSANRYASQQPQYQMPISTRPGSSAYTEQQYNNFDAAQDGRVHPVEEPQALDPSIQGSHGYKSNAAAYTDTAALGSLAYASGLGLEQPGHSASRRVNSPLTGPPVNPARSQPANTTVRTSAAISLNSYATRNGHYYNPRSDSRNSRVSIADEKSVTPQPHATSHNQTPPSNNYDDRQGQAWHQQHTVQHLDNNIAQSNAPSARQIGSSSNVSRSGPQSAEGPPCESSAREAGRDDELQQKKPTPREYQGHHGRAGNQVHYAGPVNPTLPEPTQAVSNVHERERSRSSSNIPQYPTTVDPSQVFNHYEYQRRKTAADAEALAAMGAPEAAKALKKQWNGIRAPETHHPKGESPIANAAAPASDEVALASPSERDQIEEEMKAMLERMREYKAKNPTLFSQIWEQVKKGQPPNGASSQAPSSAKETGRNPGSVIERAAETSSELTENGQLPSPSLTTVQHLSTVESTPELLPDLGKFPAQRRKRHSKILSRTGSSSQLRDTPAKDAVTNASAQPGYFHEQSPKPAVQMDPSRNNASNRSLANLGEINESMRPAMEAFRKASTKDILRAVPAGHHAQTVKPTVPMWPSSSTPSGKTIWPENRKMALATAAKIALTSAPVNAGKAISSQDIHQLLDQNPSYIELCETLEARGFVLDRRHFAKLLLAAVPEVNSATPCQAPAGSSLQNAQEIESSPEIEQQPPLAVAADLSRSQTQAVVAPPITAVPPMHSALFNSPLRSISPSGERGRAFLAQASPKSTRGRPRRDGLPPQPRLQGPPKPRGRPRKDGLPPRQRAMAQGAQKDVTNGTPFDIMKDSLPMNDAAPVNTEPAPTPNTVQASAPVQPFYGDKPIAKPHFDAATEVSAVKDQRVQAQQSREHAAVTDTHTSVMQRQLPTTGASTSGKTASSGFGMLKLIDIPRPDSTHQAVHANGPSTDLSASVLRSNPQSAPAVRWSDGPMLSKGQLEARNQADSQTGHVGHVSMHRSPVANGAPMYPGTGVFFDNFNTAPPTRGFAPAAYQQERKDFPQRASYSPLPRQQQQHYQGIPKALSKQEMARKRNFSDIVDLTQLSEDDNEQHHDKRLRPGGEIQMQPLPSSNLLPPAPASDIISTMGRTPDPHSAPAYLTEQQMSRDPAVRERLLGTNAAQRPEPNEPIMNGNVDLSQFKFAPKGHSSQRESLRTADVVQTMDKKKAVRCSTYNAKTIARDVLIAAGHHPREKPLNWHLLPLEGNFRNVNFGSDLSTFKWDLVDPLEQALAVDTAIEDADDELDAVQNRQAPSVRTPVRRHSTRVALTASGDGDVGSVELQPQHLIKEVMPGPRARRPHNSDTRIRSRPSDPASSGKTDDRKPQGPSSAAKSEDIRRLPSGAISAFASSNISRMPAGSTQTSSSDRPSVPRVEIGPSLSHTQSSSTAPPGETPTKRRGRPPGSSRASSSASADEALTSEPKRRGRPPGSRNRTSSRSNAPSSGHFPIPTRPRGSDTTPARPSGLRNAITPSDGIAVVITTPSRNANNQRKRKDSSREPVKRSKAGSDRETQSSPAYKIYQCEWKSCKAKLHNLETLQKHVRKLHRIKENDNGIPCLWSNCGKIRRIHDKGSREKKDVHYPYTFSTEALWDEHMDKKHLEPTAWTLGDGPSAHPSDTEASDYLSDTQGRRVTPLARTKGPPDPLFLPSEAGPTRAYHKAHGNKTEREKAQAVLAACEARVAAVGPGIDRGGCTLVTPERRARLVDDAFRMRVVDATDDVPELPGERRNGGRK